MNGALITCVRYTCVYPLLTCLNGTLIRLLLLDTPVYPLMTDQDGFREIGLFMAPFYRTLFMFTNKYSNGLKTLVLLIKVIVTLM